MCLNDTGETPTNIEVASSEPNVVAQTSNINAAPSISKGKRKAVAPRSNVWGHFTKIEGNTKCKCNYCDQIFTCDTVSCGTSTLRTHLKSRCKKCPFSMANICKNDQAQISLGTSVVNEGVEGESKTTLLTWKYDQQLIRKALALMVVIDELPFRFVEGQGFKHFCNIAQPKFHIPSRTTIARDCYEIYVEEMLKLKTFMKYNCRRICLTTDTWTSLQRINYMCLTAHFIDNNWKLHKKILNFCPISSHKGEAIGKAIEKCLNAWGIEKVMAVTMDNASSNDVAVQYLKRRVNNWEGSVLKGEFLHIRCVAHIMNLIVNDGLKLSNDSIARIRNAVKFVRQSPSRLQKFKICVEEEKIQSNSLLCLDVPTRWNSTFLMLDTAQKFQKAFERYEEQDPFFRSELNEGDGKPQEEDWENARQLTKLLKTFYDATLKVSGTSYVTSNTYVHEISNVEFLLKEWSEFDDHIFSDMALKMKLKCDKYWGNPEKLNLMMFFAVVFDPRYKLDYIEFSTSEMYDVGKAMTLYKRVKASLYALYDEYKNLEANSIGQGQQRNVTQMPCSSASASTLSDSQGSQSSLTALQHRYKQRKAEKDGGDAKSELLKYLEEDTEECSADFDILSWWKVNSGRFPIVSLMARDILAIPISTVASESAFSTGGRVLDAFRSSLSPKIVEALICTQDWIRNTRDRVNNEEILEEIDQLDEEFSKVKLAPVVIDVP